MEEELKHEIAVRTLKEIFEFGIYKLDNNLCTPEEIDCLADAAKSTLNLQASIPDLARFFGVSEQKVRNTINRKLLDKPKRRVYYPFQSFLRIAPKKWRKNAE